MADAVTSSWLSAVDMMAARISRQEDTGDEYQEDLRYHANVDGFLIAIIEQQSVAEEHTAGNANRDSCGQRDKHPYRSNAAGVS